MTEQYKSKKFRCQPFQRLLTKSTCSNKEEENTAAVCGYDCCV